MAEIRTNDLSIDEKKQKNKRYGKYMIIIGGSLFLLFDIIPLGSSLIGDIGGIILIAGE